MANAKKKCECGTGLSAIFKVNAVAAVWGSIVGDIHLQTDLMDLLNYCFNPETLKATGNVKITEQEDGTYDITTETFEFDQGEASDTWVIEHNLNKYPSVVTVDSAGRQFQAEVIYDSENQVTVYLNGSTKGKAYLN